MVGWATSYPPYLAAFELLETGAKSAGSVDTDNATHIKPTLTWQDVGAIPSSYQNNLRSPFDIVKNQDTENTGDFYDDIRHSIEPSNFDPVDNTVLTSGEQD